MCVVAAAAGYPEAPRKGDPISVSLPEASQHQLFHAGTRRDEQGTLVSAGGRVLTMTAQGSDFDQAFASVYQALEQVSFEGMQYRRDIGHQVRRP